MVKVELKDGTKIEVNEGSSILEVAKKISEGLARNAMAGKIDEEPVSNMFPSNPMLGQSYVPLQEMNRTFTPCCGLKMGTIFPELVSPYMPGQSMAENDYLRRNNEIGEGCNG